MMQLGLVGLTLVATAGVARSQDATPVATAAAAPAPHRRLQLGLSFLPMSLGKFKSSYGGMPADLDAAIAPGFAISVGYEIVRGLSVGLAPQVALQRQAQGRPDHDRSGRVEGDRCDGAVAYAYQIVDTIALYGEALPGYSLVQPKTGDIAKGAVFAFGVGAIMDLTDRTFVSLAGGYQWGFQSRTDTAHFVMDGMPVVTMTKTDVAFSYYRVALGVGARF